MAEKSEVQVTLKNVRTSYLYVFDPYEGDDGKKTYCSHLVFPQNHPGVAALKEAIRKVATDMWKDKAADVLQQLAAQDKLCLHRGDVSKAGNPAYTGMLYVSANNSIRPTVVDERRAPLTSADDKMYSGCRVNAIIGVWAQAHPKWGKRVNAQLMGLQFVAHDERLSGGGRVATAEEFDVVGTDADSAAPAEDGSLI